MSIIITYTPIVMLIRKAYKFRLEPTAEQAARLAVLCGHARFVWNQGLRFCLDKLEKLTPPKIAVSLLKLKSEIIIEVGTEYLAWVLVPFLLRWRMMLLRVRQ